MGIDPEGGSLHNKPGPTAETRALAVSRRPQQNALEYYFRLGETLAKTGFFPEVNDATKAIAKLLAAQELGIGPIAAMTGIHIVKGKVVVGANVLAGLVRRSGRNDYRVDVLSNQACHITFLRDSEEVGVSTFTIDDAKTAGLAGNDNWKKYPRNMLFARAMSNGVRWYCPDVTCGPVYTPDELDLPTDGNEILTAGVVVHHNPTPVSCAEAARLEDLIRRKGADRDKVLGHYRAETPLDLTRQLYADAVAHPDRRPDVWPADSDPDDGTDNTDATEPTTLTTIDKE